MRYGNIIYDKRNGRVNLGDDMQLIAIENLYRSMGIDYSEVLRINYSELATYSGEYVVLPIAFPLIAYTHECLATVFSERIIPVFLSLCLLADVLERDDVDYLKRFAPIGCRDVHTLKIMRAHNIPAYLNGCMTLTLPKRAEAGRGTRVYLVDLPAELRAIVPVGLLENAVSLSPICAMDEIGSTPEKEAKKRYERYIADARLVITTRLHVALPCMAAGVPVVFLKKDFSFRFAGIDAVVPVHHEGDFEQIDWEPKPVELEAHKKEVLDLAERRVRDAFSSWGPLCNLSYRLEAVERPAYFVEGVDNAKRYIALHWERGKTGSYVLWGVTQAAASLFHYIQSEYPKMRLSGVIDRNKRVKIGGVDSCPATEIAVDSGTALFICAAAAARDAMKFAKENSLKDIYNCYEMDDALIFDRTGCDEGN